MDPVRNLPSTWRWQFQNNPAGHGFIMLAKDREKIVGHYAAIPARMLVNGEEILCGYSCDTMVHPHYQRQGLFAGLAKLVYEDMADSRRIFNVWGFPNDNSMPGFTRYLGWRKANTLLARVALPEFKALFSKGDPSEFPSHPRQGLKVRPITRFGPQFDRLWRQHRPLEGIVQVRDSAYLQWRYLEAAKFEYKPFGLFSKNGVEGYFVTRIQKISGLKVCVLLDCFPMDQPELFQTAAKAARAYAACQGCAMVVAMFPWKLNRQARQGGFFAVPKLIAPKVFCLAGRFPGKDRNMWLKPESWWIGLGDTDVV